MTFLLLLSMAELSPSFNWVSAWTRKCLAIIDDCVIAARCYRRTQIHAAGARSSAGTRSFCMPDPCLFPPDDGRFGRCQFQFQRRQGRPAHHCGDPGKLPPTSCCMPHAACRLPQTAGGTHDPYSPTLFSLRGPTGEGGAPSRCEMRGRCVSFTFSTVLYTGTEVRY